MNKKLYKEVSNTGKVLNVNEQMDPYVMIKNISTTCIEATDEEIKDAKKYFNKHKHCNIHLFYDTPMWIYYERRCGICNSFIGMI